MDVVMPKRSASTPQSAPLTLIDLRKMVLAFTIFAMTNMTERTVPFSQHCC